MANLASHDLAKEVIVARLALEPIRRRLQEFTETLGFRSHASCYSSRALRGGLDYINNALEEFRRALTMLPRENGIFGTEDCTCNKCSKRPRTKQRREAHVATRANNHRIFYRRPVADCLCETCTERREAERERRRRQRAQQAHQARRAQQVAQQAEAAARRNLNAKARANG